MSSIATQIVYQLIMSNVAPMVVSSFNSIGNSFMGAKKPVLGQIVDIDEEKELERLQMDRLLKWMSIIFESDEPTPESHREYKQELYSIYKTIASDYRQYQQNKKYNGDLWVMTSYRKKNMKPLASKILCDVKLFNEGLKMYSIINNNSKPTHTPGKTDPGTNII